MFWLTKRKCSGLQCQEGSGLLCRDSSGLHSREYFAFPSREFSVKASLGPGFVVFVVAF